MGAPSSKVEVLHVTKVFSAVRTSGAVAHRVVEDISFRVSQGELVCFLGPSGCGKSTTLKMVAGLEKPTSGQILFDGEPVTGPDPRRAYIFQRFILFPWLTAVQNVEFGLKLKRMGRAERRERAMGMLEMVRLRRFADHYPWELSGGMQQRVAIARAFAVEPEVLLMDEPFGALDAQTRSEMQGELVKLWMDSEFHKTILFVTHDIGESCLLGDRIILMTAAGGIKQIFTLDLPRPRDPYDVGYVTAARAIREQLREEREAALRAAQ